MSLKIAFLITFVCELLTWLSLVYFNIHGVFRIIIPSLLGFILCFFYIYKTTTDPFEFLALPIIFILSFFITSIFEAIKYSYVLFRRKI